MPPQTSSHENENNIALAAKLSDGLRSYKPVVNAGKTDTLDNRYRIELQQPLGEYDLENARAYATSDQMEPSRALYAHICEWGTVQRYHAISRLKGLENNAITQLLAAGNITLSTNGNERYAIIYERPQGVKLSELLRKKTLRTDTHFICEKILAPLVNAIEQFAALDISHGLINSDTIYIGDTVALAPCVAEPCGFSQPFYYEPIERMQAMQCAKGEGSTAQDYYALAVVLLEILHGPEHFANFSKEKTIHAILRQGAYSTITRDKDVPETFYDFLRGILTLNPEERWNGTQVLQWLAGKHFHVLPPPTPIDAVRPYEFGAIHVNNCKELAYLFSRDWEYMIESLQNNQFTHWVSVSLHDTKLSGMVSQLSQTAHNHSLKSEAQIEEALMNIVLLLDPSGPIRINNLIMNIDGIDSLCAELYRKKLHKELQLVARFIKTTTVSYWLELQNKGNKTKYTPPAALHDLSLKLDRLRGCIGNPGLGFGLERMLYGLNPDMACISPLLGARNVTTLEELLITLDQQAPALFEQEDPLDRHIAAFIASKLGIMSEIRMDELNGIPSLVRHKTVVALYLLGSAQAQADSMRLPGLTSWLVMKTLPLMDLVHSRTVRKKYKAALMALAPGGSIPKITRLILSADYAAGDNLGFQQATITYHKAAAAIAYYRKPKNIQDRSMMMGFTIAKVVAYAALLGTLYWTLKGWA